MLRRRSPSPFTSALITVPALALSVFTLAACATSGGSGPRASESPSGSGSLAPAEDAVTELAGSGWLLASYADSLDRQATANADATSTLSFAADSRVNGSTGCNRFGGTYSQSGDSLTITPGPTTLMACGPDLTAQENDVLAALTSTASFTVADGGLRLLDASGAVVLTYTAGLTSLDGTSWQATGINNGKNAVVNNASTGNVTAAFSDGTVSGTTGCNRYSGPYSTTGKDGIKIGNLAVSAAACLDDDAAAVESQYIAALAAAVTYTIDGDRLNLRDAHGATQVSYRQVPAQ